MFLIIKILIWCRTICSIFSSLPFSCSVKLFTFIIHMWLVLNIFFLQLFMLVWFQEFVNSYLRVPYHDRMPDSHPPCLQLSAFSFLSSRQYLVTFLVYPILDSSYRVLTDIVHGQVAPSCVENFHWNFDFHYVFVICELYVLLLWSNDNY